MANQFQQNAGSIFFGVCIVAALLARFYFPSSTPASASPATETRSITLAQGSTEQTDPPKEKLTDQSRRVAYKAIGCQSYETYDRLVKFAVQGDKEAYVQLVADSDEVAHRFQFEAAQDSDFISPMIPR